MFEATGTLGQLTTTLSPGYGFTAIIVAFLGRLNPLGVIPAGLLLALSYLGGDAAQINLGLPNAVTGIFSGHPAVLPAWLRRAASAPDPACARNVARAAR